MDERSNAACKFEKNPFEHLRDYLNTILLRLFVCYLFRIIQQIDRITVSIESSIQLV